VAQLQLLKVDHAPALLAFELANRSYFAAAVPDRGDAYFDEFAERLDDLLREQQAGVCAFYVAGRGVATTTVQELCRLASERHVLRALRAAAADDNPASHKVLTNSGFIPVGPAAPEDLDGKQGTWYSLELAPQSADVPD
jgi:ribosomal-protein-alanine N-acetyltransferase